MSKLISDSDAIGFCFAPLTGIPCWGVEQGHGSFLELNFGNPRLEVEEATYRIGNKQLPRRIAKVKGDWCLLFWCCNWHVELSEGERVTSESDREEITRVLSRLSGQKFQSLSINSGDQTSVFKFDLGATLATSNYIPCYDDDGNPFDNWMLFQGRAVLTYRADGTFSFGQSDRK